MFQLLQALRPILSRSLDVLLLSALVAAEQEENYFAAAPSKVQTVAGSEVEPRFPDPAADLLVIAQVAGFES
jgi:hypothetical protein